MKYAIEGGSNISKMIYDENDLRVIQYSSAACRAARLHRVNDLASARILSMMDDHDALRCKEGRYVPIGYLTFLLTILPVLLALASQALSDGIMDIILPAVSSGFVVGNLYLYAISPLILAIPYIVATAFFIWLYIFLNPSKRRLDKLQHRDHSARSQEQWKKYLAKPKQTFWSMYLPLLSSRFADLQAYVIASCFSWEKHFLHRHFFSSAARKRMDRHWRWMNHGYAHKTMGARRATSPPSLSSSMSFSSLSFASHSGSRREVGQQDPMQSLDSAIKKMLVKSSRKQFSYLRPHALVSDSTYDMLAISPITQEEALPIVQEALDKKKLAKKLSSKMQKENASELKKKLPDLIADIAARHGLKYSFAQDVESVSKLRRKMLNESFSLDNLWAVLDEALTHLPPGGYELTRMDRDDIEEAMVTWATKYKGFLDGIKLKDFIAWLESVYDTIDETYNRAIVFEDSPEHRQMEEEAEEDLRRQQQRERSLRRLRSKSEKRAAASPSSPSSGSLALSPTSASASFSSLFNASWK